MKVIIFGATGMVGQGVLRECLRAPDVELVFTVGRSPAAEQNSDLRGPRLRRSSTAIWQIFRRSKANSPASTPAFSRSVSRQAG